MRHCLQPGLQFCLLLLLALLPMQTSASEPSSVLGPGIPYGLLVEGEQTLTFDEARQRLQGVEHSQKDIFAAGYVDDVYWLTFHIPQRTFQEGEQGSVWPPIILIICGFITGRVEVKAAGESARSAISRQHPEATLITGFRCCDFLLLKAERAMSLLSGCRVQAQRCCMPPSGIPAHL